MIRKALFAVFLVSVAAASAMSQFPQAQKARDKMDASSRASADPDAAKAPLPFKAKTNVDVRMVIAGKDAKSFAEAQPIAVTKVADGQPLWLYLKFNGNLSKYVLRKKIESSTDRYLLAVEVGKTHYLLSFTEPELAATELKIALTNGIPGRNRSLPVFLKYAAGATPTTGSTVITVTNNFAIPRDGTYDLAKMSLAADLSKGNAQYTKLLTDYEESLIRGTSDLNAVPVAAKFDDAGIRARLTADLRDSGIEPEKLYFTADDWLEYSDSPIHALEKREIGAAFTYTREGKCFFGTALITQDFDPMKNAYGASIFKIERDMPRACSPAGGAVASIPQRSF